MSELKYDGGSIEWAKDKGIIRRCSKHNINYDPHIGCKKCIEEEYDEKKRIRKKLWDSIIWPDNK